MFGQYSSDTQGKRSVADLRASAAQDHGAAAASARRIANNTIELSLPNGRRIIRHQDTDILTFAKGGAVTLNSGGWQTVTTKARMNKHLPAGFYVYSDRGWYVRTPAGTFPFVDGMTLRPDGSLSAADARRAAAKARQVERDKALIAKALKHFQKNGAPDPAGDPWIIPDSRGLYPEDVVRDWLRGNYITRLVVMQALVRAGCGLFWLHQVDRKLATREPLASHELSKVRRFLKACLDIGA